MESFVKDTLSEFNISDFSFTSHSLGGALAQYMAVLMDRNANAFAAARAYRLLTEEQQALVDSGKRRLYDKMNKKGDILVKKNKWFYIGIVSLIIIIIIGGNILMKKNNELGKNEKKIASEFARKYLDPENNEVHTVTFYKNPVKQKDFTGNVNYFFYINENEKWKIGASVKEETGEIWAFGSDFLNLIHKKKEKEITDLKVEYKLKEDIL